MKRDRFISALRDECAARGWRLVVDTKLGKGSHYRLEVWDGDRMISKTTLKSGELSPLYEKLVRKQLSFCEERTMQYSCKLEPNGDGGFVATFRDVPEALTEGATREEALSNAADALEVALLGRMKDGDDIPSAAKTRSGVTVYVPAQSAAKVALYVAFRASGLSQSALGRKIGKDEAEIRRMLDPYHATKLPPLEEALLALGKRLVIDIKAA